MNSPCNERKTSDASDGDALSETLPPTPIRRKELSWSAPLPLYTPPPSPPFYAPAPNPSFDMYSPVGVQRFVAIDCEMVGVGPGGLESALARVTLVDYHARCLLDTFVKVEEPIMDYRTYVSGISPRELQSAEAISFDECRDLVKSLIKHKILVGHGLKNDLNVLSIQHPWYNIRDTSMYQPYMRMGSCGRWRSRRLKHLASMHLGITIQKNGIPHDSFDDAAAAMALYRNVQMEWDYAMECKRQTYLWSSPTRMKSPLAQTI